AMSSIGNPIGVLIALKTGLGFIDFLKWSAPVALVVNVVTYLICRWWFADAFEAFAKAVHAEFEAVRRRRAAAAAAAAPALAAVGAGGGSISARRDDPDVDDYESPARRGDNVMSETFFSADAAPA